MKTHHSIPRPLTSLVDMWAHVYDTKGVHILTIFFTSQLSDEYYLVQAINALTGEPNVGRVVHLSQMDGWLILPTKEIAESVRSATDRTGSNPYSFKLPTDAPFMF